jgi:flagellar biosynthesis GTPase FlhF
VAEVVYQFVALGADDITAAFEGHARAAERAARAAEDSYQRTGRGAGDTGRKQKTEAELAAAAAEKAAARKTKADEKAASASQKAAERASAASAKASEKAASAAEKAAARGAKATEKAEQQKAKASDQWTDRRIKNEEKWARESARAAASEAKAAENAQKRKAAAQSHATGSKLGGWADKGANVALGLAAAGAASVTALVGKAVSDVVSTQTLANRISINGRAPGHAGVDPASIRKELEATAIAHAGQTAEGLAGGVSAYQENRGGDRAKALEEARKYTDVIATVSSATGKGADEIGKASAILARTGQATSVDEMGDALARLVAHAQKTGEPLDEAIAHLDKMSASAKRFGLTGPHGAAQLGALQVLGAEGAGAGQADKAVEGFFKKVTNDKTARKLKAAGVDPYADANGNLKDPREFFKGLYGKVGTSASASDKVSTINAMLGPMGAKMADPLSKAFEKGYGGTTGTNDEKVAAGVDAMLAAFDRAAAETGSYADTQASAKQAETDSTAQLTAAYEQIKAVVGAELAPQLAALAVELARDPGAIAEFTQGIRAAAKVLALFAKATSFVMKYSGMGQEAAETSAILDYIEGKKPGAEGGPAPPIDKGTGLPAYATNPAATGQPAAFRMVGDMPPAVGPGQGAAGAPQGPGPLAGAGAGQGAGATDAASAFKAIIEAAGKAFLDQIKTASLGGKGDVFGGGRSAVDPS